jgi:hypothetical protein
MKKSRVNIAVFIAIMVIIGNIFSLTLGFIFGDKIQMTISTIMIFINGVIGSLQVYYLQKYKVFSDKFNVDYEKAMQELEVKNTKIKESKDFIYKFIYENKDVKDLPLIISELYKRGFSEELINECLSDLITSGIIQIQDETKEEKSEVVENEEINNKSRKPKNTNA